MNNSGNFILKVHMQDTDLKEIFLNKDKRCFTFINDECVADLVLPEFKLTSLKMLIKNVVNEEQNDDYYAEYDYDGLKVSEYDKEKVAILGEMVTSITIKDFLEYIDRVKQNDFYIDSIVDIYNATIPEEVKRLVSYTTNGFTFNESNLRMLSHDEIFDSKLRKLKFIPIFNLDNNYYGYDLKERKYAKYVNDELYEFYDKLDELLNLEEKDKDEDTAELEIIDFNDEKEEHDEESVEVKEEVGVVEEAVEETPILEEEPKEDEDSLFAIVTEEEQKAKEEKIKDQTEEPVEIKEEVEVVEETVEETPKKEKKKKKKKNKEVLDNKQEIDENYNKTIKNIEEQFDKLNTQVEIEQEPENIYTLDIDKLFSNYKVEVKKPNVYKMDLDKLFAESQIEVKKKKEENAYEMDLDSLFSNYKVEVKEPKKESDYALNAKDLFTNYEIETIKPKAGYELANKELFNNCEIIPKTTNASEIKHAESAYSLGKANLFKEETSRYQLMKTNFDVRPEDLKVCKDNTEEYEFVVSQDITDTIRESVKKSLKKIEKEELAEIDLERLIDNSLTDSVNNYRIKFNDSMKLVVEHIPYYENNNSFGVVQIPQLEVNKYTLLPGGSIDFDRLKFKVVSLTAEKAELLIDKATNISNESGDKIKRGDTVKLNSNSELVYLLDKKDAMESWTFRLEKTVYEKEFRHIEYNKLLNLIKFKTNYEQLTNIEKLETQKSIMLFMNLIMTNNEPNKLEELYEVIKNGDNYAKYVTEYNNNCAYQDKDSLPSYSHKKDFLEKLKLVNNLIEKDQLTYPRFIYSSYNYFDGEQILEDYLDDINESIKENDFSNYLKGLFKEKSLFVGLDELGRYNLNKCLEYLSVLYKFHPIIGEEDKYKIENTIMESTNDEDMALLISKLCRKGIKDYNSFKEYDSLMKEEYRTGNLKYPLYSEDFDIDEVRKGGEYDEL